MTGGGYRLERGESAAEGVRRVISGRLEKAAERLRENGADGDLPVAIHGARKDLKKARAALRTVRPELSRRDFKRENRRLRDAARMLAASRDAEVKLVTLEALAEDAGPSAPPGPLRIWHDALATERDRVTGGAGSGAGDLDDQIARATWAIEASLAAVPALRLKRGGWRLLEAGFDRAYREGRTDLASVRRKPSSTHVHDWRKRVKDLWYQLRLVEAAWPGQLAASAGEVHELTELLGDHHDLAVLREDLAGRPEVGSGPAAVFGELIAQRQASLLDEALVLGDRVYAERPKAHRRRLRAYWRAWRRPA